MSHQHQPHRMVVIEWWIPTCQNVYCYFLLCPHPTFHQIPPHYIRILCNWYLAKLISFEICIICCWYLLHFEIVRILPFLYMMCFAFGTFHIDISHFCNLYVLQMIYFAFGIFCTLYILHLVSFTIRSFAIGIFCNCYILQLVSFLLIYVAFCILHVSLLRLVSCVIVFFCYLYMFLFVSFALGLFTCIFWHLYLLLLVSFVTCIICYWYFPQVGLTSWNICYSYYLLRSVCYTCAWLAIQCTNQKIRGVNCEKVNFIFKTRTPYSNNREQQTNIYNFKQTGPCWIYAVQKKWRFRINVYYIDINVLRLFQLAALCKKHYDNCNLGLIVHVLYVPRLFSLLAICFLRNRLIVSISCGDV